MEGGRRAGTKVPMVKRNRGRPRGRETGTGVAPSVFVTSEN
jgi:hypothetical protein